MRVSLSTAQVEIGQRFAELVDDELIPSIRRMGELPRHGSAAEAAAEAVGAADARSAVWRALVDLGATRLLLPARFGGEDAGQQGAVVLAELLGTALYQGPLLDTMIAAELLAHSGDAEAKRIAEIAEGAAVPLAVRQSARDDHARPGPFEVSAGGETIDATRRFVGFVPDGSYLLVVGGTMSGPRAALVPREHPSVSYRLHDEVGRGGLYALRLTDTPVLSWPDDPAGSSAAWPRVVAHARIRHAAYLIGLCQGALDLAVARSGSRHQFGEPIGKFQAPAFRLAEIATQIEAARWLVRAAAWDADSGQDARLPAAQALALAADLAGATVLAAVQVHGAYGLTEDSDIQLYFRRAHIDRVWMGAPRNLRQEVLPLLAQALRARHRKPSPGGAQT